MKIDVKTGLIILVIVVVGSIAAHFLMKEKIGISGKHYKSAIVPPTVPPSDQAAPAGN
jgi:hypothetical protein